MEHASSSIADLVTGIMMLLLIAAVTTLLSKRVDKLPLTILLVFVGIAIAALGKDIPGLTELAEFHLTPELVLFVFIPTLIFESAFNLDVRQVSRNIWPILVLAIPGLLLSTALIGLMVAGLTHFSLMVALLLGAILSATDPVAVISIFKQLGVPERLTILVEGESLFNDATSLVLATLLIGILSAGTFSQGMLLEGLGEFFLVFFGGAVVGAVLALVVGMTLGAIESDAAIEITLTTILAYLSFIVAEHVFHVSGIMAVVAAGLMIGSWGKSKISPSTSEFMEHFWEYLAFVANALIFLMVGLQIDLVTLWQSYDLIALVFVAMLISRALVIFAVVPLVGKLPESEPIGLPFQTVMYWGGLRGAIALAIVLSLPAFEYKDELVAIVMGAVLATLVIQGLSIESIVKWLGLNKLSVADNLARLEGDKHAREEGLDRLDGLVEGGHFSQRIADNLREKCERNLRDLSHEIDALNGGMSVEERTHILAMRCLAREKARIYELFSRGLINEWAFRELDHTVTVQLEGVRHSRVLPTDAIELSLGKAIHLGIIRLLERIPGGNMLSERMRTQRIIRDFDVAWGRYRSVSSVLSGMHELAGESAADAAVEATVRAVYEHMAQQTKAEIDEVGDQYPEFVETVQEQLGQRLLLVAEHESVEHAAQLGLIQEGIAHYILKDQSERIRQLKKDDVSACFELEISELLRNTSIFAEINEQEFESISRLLRPRTVPRGTAIVRQGQQGDSMFLIARGVAHVMIDVDGADQQVASLFAGDILGEAALLHGTPRNATVVAATPCSLYVLQRADLDKLLEAYPELRNRVLDIDRQRTSANTETGHGQTK
ncbi:MAG: cation:proton antiporter [Proteobacteria bacterium]|jgi:CPA1 family monovalent cation:H+ antiporter|nr:cation:proton antiporter [Pseudomonadota bacterium]MDA1300033.1 cation:proton antiporter [Pseudomonadota bacterium]